ncbi:hypothetical protein [Roseicella aerolata]|uniref:Uncharacterized protein n=1 Tax=Roseicella aerolata TaxID=2883479 RepID=A0A9X1IBJ9_9PROT|nr:hypothetical protein [Roseicella aerolata]MCB4820844.1 hypothetical protein [Roseicella aerolata]
MSQDVDITRVAAALKTPGLRYRSFDNEPVRPVSPPAAKAAVTIPALETPVMDVPEAPRASEEASPTMTLIADALSSMAPPVPPPASAAATGGPSAWPLLDAVRQPAGTPVDAMAGGTLVRLFGTAAAPTAAPPADPPRAGWLPGVVAAAPVPPAPLLPAAAPPPLVPAGRVTVPLTDLFHTLGHGQPAAPSPFAALRLPGGTPGSR